MTFRTRTRTRTRTNDRPDVRDANRPSLKFAGAMVAAGLALTSVGSPVAHAAPVVTAALGDTPDTPAGGEVASTLDPNGTLLPQLASERSNTFLEADGSFTVQSFTSPVNYQDTSGNWRPIDSSFVDSPAPQFAVENADNSFSAQIPSDASATPVKFSVAHRWVSMRMHGLDDAPIVDGSEAVFVDAGEASEVSYAVTPTGLKEDVVLQTPPSADDMASIQFTYSIQASPDLRPVIAEDGSIDFVTSDDDAVVSMPPGVMFDAAVPSAATSGDVTFALDAVGDGWLLTVRPSMAWLLDPMRTYPVTIDPSLTLPKATTDCWIRQSAPTQNACTSSSIYLKTGRSDASSRYRSLLDFDVSAIPESATVSSASMTLNLAASESLNNLATEYAVFQPGRKFDNSATWNSSGANGAWASGGGDPSGAAYGTLTLSGQTGGPRAFTGLASLVQGWVDTSRPRAGLVLKQVSESTNNVISFYSSSSSNDTSLRPTLSVNYSDPTPVPKSGGTYTQFSTPTLVYDSATASKIPAGGERMVSTTSFAPTADPLDVGGYVLTVTAKNWTQAGNLVVYDIDLGESGAPSVIFSRDDDPARGRTVTALMSAAADGNLTIRNNSTAAVDVSLSALGWYPFIDAGESDDVTDAASTDPYMDQNIGSDLQPTTSYESASVNACGDAAVAARYQESGGSLTTQSCATQDTTAASVSISSADRGGSLGVSDSTDPAGQSGSSTLLTNENSCWPSTADTSTWYTHRYELCSVRKYVVYFYEQRNLGQPPVIVGNVKYYNYRTIALSQTNTTISVKQQLVWASCDAEGCDHVLTFDTYGRCESVCGDPYQETLAISALDRYSFMIRHDFSAPPTYPESSRTVTIDGYVDLLGGTFYDKTRIEEDGSPYIRCDSATYFAQGPGCVVLHYVPTFALKLSDPAVHESAVHIQEQQAIFPYGILYPLSRGNPTLKKANRRAACALWNPAQGSCDEWPFATTEQGCAVDRIHCSRKGIPVLDNKTSGARLGAFYRKARIMRDGDQFYVEIKP